MNPHAAKKLLPALLIVCLALVTGCSSFDRDWNAAASFKPASATDITGRWEGTWQSDVDNHSGGLRGLITQTGKDTYHARYAATYGGILHFNYEMDLTGQQTFDWITFQGSADLGALAGGTYHYEGHATSERFFATYRSADDHGEFNMKRPEEH
jgi:hypothetical protein